jgi:hypothetical protein
LRKRGDDLLRLGEGEGLDRLDRDLTEAEPNRDLKKVPMDKGMLLGEGV